MKASSKIFLFVTLLLLVLVPFNTQAADYITPVQTPDAPILKWATQIGEGWQKSAGVPIIAEDYIFIISGDELLKVEPTDGSVLERTTMSAAQSYGYVAPTYANGKIYMNLSDGTIQAFDAKTLESEWVYVHPDGGKGMTDITYYDNVLYTGFWHSETKDADFIALDSSTGELLWSKTVNGGFYWAGAYCNDSAVIFATDDGSDKIAHIYSCDRQTGEVYSYIDIENKGDIRSTVTYYNGRIYVTTKGGYIISAALNENILSDVKYGEIGAASTSTPVIYDGRIYIGAGDKTISVFDSSTLEKLFSIPVTAYPQCTPLISTYYADNGYLYLYTTYNKTPGGITLIKIKTDAASADDCIVSELYDAKGYEQYCISDIICDGNGTLYYKNDSGYLFALSEKITVKASLAEDGYIFAPVETDVKVTTAESYGYTDTVTDGVSALDVLVKIHEAMLGEEFTPLTANDYLIVSSEGYLSRIMGYDTYNFGFAVNGAAPHDDVLTEYGYTGYSLNQAQLKNGDTAEFFIYRDSWAMDTYCNFIYNSADTKGVKINKGETIELTLVGYPFGWYSCYEDSKIEDMKFPVANAQIMLNGETITTTDENGCFSVNLDSVGSHILTIKEQEGSTVLIPVQLEIDVLGIEIAIKDNKAVIMSNLAEKIDAMIITATYSSDTMTKATMQKTTLAKGYSETTINISDEDCSIFVWNEKLEPLFVGGAVK